MRIMHSEALARDPALIDELENEALACEIMAPQIADLLRRMAQAGWLKSGCGEERRNWGAVAKVLQFT